MKHTKGRWRVAYENKNAVVSEIDNKILTICTTTNGTGKYMTQQEAEQNARLIAAAPELLNALEFLLQSYKSDFKTITGFELKDTLAVLFAKEVIKKATENQ